MTPRASQTPHVLAALALDAAIAAAWMQDWLGPGAALATHAAGVAALALARRPTARLRGPTAAGLLFFGPAGALLAMAGAGRPVHAREEAAAARQPVAGPDASAAALQIAQGRAYAAPAAPVRSLDSILASGGTDARQRALGHIAQGYTPDHRRVLVAALRSREAATRVSAAAVYAKTRDAVRLRQAQLLETPAPQSCEEATALARELWRCARSGLLDEADARACLTKARDAVLAWRPHYVGPDETEALASALLAELGDDHGVCERLAPASARAPAALRAILVRAALRCGRDIPSQARALAAAAPLRAELIGASPEARS